MTQPNQPSMPAQSTHQKAEISYILNPPTPTPPIVPLTLYSWPLSECCTRVRIALNIKGIPYTIRHVDLDKNDHHGAVYRLFNEAAVVPTLVIPNCDPHSSQETLMAYYPFVVLTQSVPIMEYLDEAYPPTCSLLPGMTHLFARHQVRKLVSLLAADTHPLTTKRVHEYISKALPCKDALELKSEGYRSWDRHFLTAGLQAYEWALIGVSGIYSVGDNLTIADICLMSSLWSALRMGINLRVYPSIFKIFRNLSFLDAFAKERPQLSRLELHEAMIEMWEAQTEVMAGGATNFEQSG